MRKYMKVHAVAGIKILALAAIYFVAAKFGLAFDAVSGFATLVWPPTGIALAALVLFGSRLWPGIFLGAVIANVSEGAPVLVALGIGIGNTLEAVAATYLLNRVGFRPTLERLPDTLWFFLLAGVLSTAVSASVGVTSLWFGGITPTSQLPHAWAAWWIGDMLGAFIVTPFLLTWLTRPSIPLQKYWLAKASGSLLVLVLLTSMVFRNLLLGGHRGSPLSYPFPVLVPLYGIALWFCPRVVSVASLLTSTIAIWGTTQGLGPFGGETLSGRLLLLQVFMGVASSSSLTFTALIAEKRIAATELERINRQLRESRQKLQAIFDYLPIGVTVVRPPHGEIDMGNQRAMQLGGREEVHNLRGRRYSEVYDLIRQDGTTYPREELPTNRTLRTGTTESKRDVFIRRPDGSTRAISITSAPLFNDRREMELVFTVFDDITNEIELERTRREFVSIASHQLRTPLTAINWYTERLRNGKAGPLNAEQQKYFQAIQHNNQRMLNLVNALLNVSRVELGILAITPVPTDIVALTDDVMRELSVLTRDKQLAVTVRHALAREVIAVDRDLFRIVIHNIISNAIYYTPDGGAIHLETMRVPEGQAVGGQRLKGENLVITVTDTGFGIPLQQQAKIFTKFFRAGNAATVQTQGTGLGLYIARSILEQADGTIWFISAEGRGTTFYLALPMTGMHTRTGTLVSLAAPRRLDKIARMDYR